MRKIKVAVDIRDLRIARTGARTYLEETCNAFKKGDPDFIFTFVDTWLPVYTGNNKIGKIIEHIRFFLWKQITLPLICWFKGCDVVFCTDYFVPYIKLGYKTAVVFHDAFFWEYPEHYNRLWLTIMKTIGVAAAKRADAILTVTEYAKKQIVARVGLDPEKIHVIYLAPKSSIKHLNTLEAATDPGKKYILHIGVLEKRKNLLQLINAFDLLLKEGFTDYYLVLGGSRVAKKTLDDSGNIQALINSLGLQERVILAGFIPDEQLAYYYKNASVYAFVSINEGFGIPVLEAFQNNLPILIADNTSLPEVGGDAVISCDPFNSNDIKEKLRMIIQDPTLQASLIKKGQERLRLYSWDITSHKMMDLFKKIVQK